MNMKWVATLIAACAMTGCGNEIDSMLSHGTTSSGGLMPSNLTVSCRPSEIVDAGYSLNAVVMSNGTAAVRLAKIGFIGTVEIDESFAAKHQVIFAGGHHSWQLAHEDFQLAIRLQGNSQLMAGALVRGSLVILTERFAWGPNDINVVCDVHEAAPPSEALRAVRLSMFGMGPPVDGEAYQAMKSLIGSLVADGTLGTYVMEGHGIEGGEQCCIELDPFVQTEALGGVLASLRSIKPNPRTTSYQVTPVISCSESVGE